MPTGRSAPSPFDAPTERFPAAPGATPVARTDDEFGTDPTMPTYRAGQPQDTSSYAFSSPPPADASPPGRDTRDNYTDERPARGTTDLGLLVLRVSVGALFFVHGLQKLTGWWGGPGLDGLEPFMRDGGWDQPQLLGILLMVGELAGGALLILGLATPLAAASLLAIAIDAWLFRQVMEPGLQFFQPAGPELETLLVAVTASIVLCGPGRYSMDGGRGWATKPFIGSFVALLIGAAAAACVWIFLRGGNPFI